MDVRDIIGHESELQDLCVLYTEVFISPVKGAIENFEILEAMIRLAF